MSPSPPPLPLGLFIQPACLQHRYIRHANASHIVERPERLRAVLLGVAAALARLESVDTGSVKDGRGGEGTEFGGGNNGRVTPSASASNTTGRGAYIGGEGLGAGAGAGAGASAGDDLSTLLSGLSIQSTFSQPRHAIIVAPPLGPLTPGQILLHHPAVQLAHSPPAGEGLPGTAGPATSPYMRNLVKWASEAVEMIRSTGCEIPPGLGLNQGDLYLGPGSILAMEGAIQTVCQAIDHVAGTHDTMPQASSEPSTPPPASHTKPGAQTSKATTPAAATSASYFASSVAPVPSSTASTSSSARQLFRKAFCAIRPPGHHCGEDTPSGFCYVNNVVVGAMHAYLEHDIDRAIIIDFDLHHGNGTQALVMPLNAASHAEDLAVKAGKPPSTIMGRKGKRRRGWKGFYGSVHDIYSYPCEDGDLELIKDASLSLAAHGQYIENIHLQPYSSEEDFYARIYPKYLALLAKAEVFMRETDADAEDTVVLISAGFDACEHEHQTMQRHDRRVPVSFFERYTRDIAAFADRVCQGKVVSVLEGGYSDRALTSASMGHVVGMLRGIDAESAGLAQWWSAASLDEIERATKKKRTGRIAPFPPELSHLPHLARTHALLAHFETVGLPPDAHPPSAHGTPQQTASGRGGMTLRARRANGAHGGAEQDETVTPPPAAGRRGRGGARGVALGPSATTASASGTNTPTAARRRQVSPRKEDLNVVSASAMAAEVDVIKAERKQSPSPIVHAHHAVSHADAAPTLVHPDPIHPPPPAISVPLSSNGGLTDATKEERILLRFKRPTSTTPPPADMLDDPVTPPAVANRLYPQLPLRINGSDDRLAYREASMGASSSDGDTSYVTASAGEESDRGRGDGTT